MKYPGEVLRKHQIVVWLTIALLVIGFCWGTVKGNSAIENGNNGQVNDYHNVAKTAYEIWLNNAMVVLQASSGITTFQTAIFSVGIVFGALFVMMPFSAYVAVLSAFGFLELFAAFLAIFSGLLLLKAVVLKVRKQHRLTELFVESVVVFTWAVVLLIPSAVLEAVLLYSAVFNTGLLSATVIVGLVISIGLVYFTLKRRGD